MLEQYSTQVSLRRISFRLEAKISPKRLNVFIMIKATNYDMNFFMVGIFERTLKFKKKIWNRKGIATTSCWLSSKFQDHLQIFFHVLPGPWVIKNRPWSPFKQPSYQFPQFTTTQEYIKKCAQAWSLEQKEPNTHRSFTNFTILLNDYCKHR